MCTINIKRFLWDIFRLYRGAKKQQNTQIDFMQIQN